MLAAWLQSAVIQVEAAGLCAVYPHELESALFSTLLAALAHDIREQLRGWDRPRDQRVGTTNNAGLLALALVVRRPLVVVSPASAAASLFLPHIRPDAAEPPAPLALVCERMHYEPLWPPEHAPPRPPPGDPPSPSGGSPFRRPRPEERGTGAGCDDDRHNSERSRLLTTGEFGALVLCSAGGCRNGLHGRVGARHLGCMEPPLTEVPAGEWYCCDLCAETHARQLQDAADRARSDDARNSQRPPADESFGVPREPIEAALSPELLAQLASVDAAAVMRMGLPPLLAKMPPRSLRQLTGVFTAAHNTVARTTAMARAAPAAGVPTDPRVAPWNLGLLFAILFLVRPAPDEPSSKKPFKVVNRRIRTLLDEPNGVASLLAYAARRRREMLDQRADAQTNLTALPAAGQLEITNTNIIARAERFFRMGEIGRGLKALGHVPLPPEDEVIAKLDSLCLPPGLPVSARVEGYVHNAPCLRPDADEAEDDSDRRQPLRETLVRLVKEGKGAAAGPSGLSNLHLLQIIADCEPAAEALARSTRVVADADVPPAIRVALRMSRLVAIGKAAPPNQLAATADPNEIVLPPPASEPGSPADPSPAASPRCQRSGRPQSGSRKVRPIAIGEVYRRLPMKAQLRENISDWRVAVGATQLAIEPCAAEIGYQAMELRMAQPNMVAFHLDVQHAFGSAHKAIGLEGMLEHMPVAVPMARLFYGGGEELASDLLFETRGGPIHVLRSQAGWDQGCVDAGLGFALSLRPALDELAAAYPDVLSMALADDLSGAGPAARVAGALTLFLRADGPFRQANLSLAPDKPVVIWSKAPLTDAERSAFPSGLNYKFTSDGFILHGLPHGTDAFILEHVSSAATARLATVAAGSNLEQVSAQSAFMAARLGVNARFNNLLRCIPPRLLAAAAATWDTALREFVERLLHQQLPPAAVAQHHLPLRLGGAGFLSMLELRHTAYLAGWLACRSGLRTKFPALGADLAEMWRRADALVHYPPGAARGPLAHPLDPLAADLAAAFREVTQVEACRIRLEDALGCEGLGAFAAADPPAKCASLQRLQESLSVDYHKIARQRLLDSVVDAKDQSWLEHKAGYGASAVLTAVSGWQPANRLDDALFIQFLADHYRLDHRAGAVIIQRLCPHKRVSEAMFVGGRPSSRRWLAPNEQYEACRALVDPKLDHPLVCREGADGLIGRHNAVNAMVAAVTLDMLRFVPGVRVTTGDARVRAWMVSQGWPAGRFDAGDLVAEATTPVDAELIPAAADRLKIPDIVVEIGAEPPILLDTCIRVCDVSQIEENKITQYRSLLNAGLATRDQVIPFAMNTAGEFGARAESYLGSLSRLAALSTEGLRHDSAPPSLLGRRRIDQKAAVLKQQMVCAIACTLARKQAAMKLRAVALALDRDAAPQPPELVEALAAMEAQREGRRCRGRPLFFGSVADSLVNGAPRLRPAPGFCPRTAAAGG